MEKDKAHPLNTEGDFYVLDGCCTSCGIPETYAKDLFGTETPDNPNGHCYVKHQPINEDELERMVKVMICSELECIRYRGQDENIKAKIVTGLYGYSGTQLID